MIRGIYIAASGMLAESLRADVNGTISTNTLGGTAVGWTAGVTQTFTLNSTYSYISAGEWVVVQYNEVNAGNPTGGFVVLEYQMGR